MTNRYPKQNNEDENESSSSDYVKNLREELRGKTNYHFGKAEEKYGNADEVYQKEVSEIIANAQENVRGNLIELVRKLEESNLEQDEIVRRLREYE